MTSPSIPHEAQQALKLLQGYSFDLIWRSADSQIVEWLQQYRASWIRDAIIEALHQGRYKAVSVQQILALWKRRGQPIRHFNREFEQMIGCRVGIRLGPLALPPKASSSPPLNSGDPTVRESDTSEQPADLLTQSEPSPSDGEDANRLTQETIPSGLQSQRLYPLLPMEHKTAQSPAPPDNGILYALHQPIQPFRPARPFSETSPQRPRSIRVSRARR